MIGAAHDGLSERRRAWPTPAQELLLRAALLPDERALGAWRRLRPELERATLDGAARAVLPILRRNLVRLGADDDVLGRWGEANRFAWANNQLLFRLALPLVDRLEGAGITTMLLKGASFSAVSGTDGVVRTMGDVDVLVPTARAREAIDVLVAAGLAPVGGIPPWYVERYAPRFVPSHAFRGSGECELDLHWHLLHWSCHPEADEDFWSAAQPLEIDGVHTRKLCAADELLHVIVHGLRWSPIPSYRWVIDATLLARGAHGAIDYDRLVREAAHHRVVAPLRSGLEYLRRAVDAPIPDTALRPLQSMDRPWVERIEFRAQTTAPRQRTSLQRLVVEHQQYLRRHLALAERPTVRRRIELARRQLGIDRWRDLGHALSGGRPGPGRPASEMGAAVGTGTVEEPLAPAELGGPIDFGLAGGGQRCVAYGAWLAEREGCWLAGREARLVVPAPLPAARAPLLLGVWADGFLPAGRRRQRLRLIVNGRRLADWILDRTTPTLRGEAILVPPELVTGRSRLELLLRTPDAVSPAQLGLEDDDRRIGVFLRRLFLRAPTICPVGAQVRLGVGVSDAGMLVRGWGDPEPFGRWTLGPEAEVLLRVPGEASPGPIEVEFDAHAFLGRPGRRLQVELSANGRAAGRVEYGGRSEDPRPVRVRLPAGAIGADGQLRLAWRIRDPRSPAQLGLSADRRPLGLFMRRISLRPGPPL